MNIENNDCNYHFFISLEPQGGIEAIASFALAYFPESVLCYPCTLQLSVYLGVANRSHMVLAPRIHLG